MFWILSKVLGWFAPPEREADARLREKLQKHRKRLEQVEEETDKA